MGQAIVFTDAEGNQHIIEPMAQGNAVVASSSDRAKDASGYTHPNLHRRIDETPRELPEVAPRNNKLLVGGVNSYRFTKINTHDESATDTEVP